MHHFCAAGFNLGKRFFFDCSDHNVVALRARSIEYQKRETPVARDEAEFGITAHSPLLVCPLAVIIYLIPSPLSEARGRGNCFSQGTTGSSLSSKLDASE